MPLFYYTLNNVNFCVAFCGRQNDKRVSAIPVHDDYIATCKELLDKAETTNIYKWLRSTVSFVEKCIMEIVFYLKDILIARVAAGGVI